MTDFLDNLANDQHQKMLREIANDDLTPKKKDKITETELFELIVTLMFLQCPAKASSIALSTTS